MTHADDCKNATARATRRRQPKLREPLLGSTQVQSSSPLIKPRLQFIKRLFNSHSALLEQIPKWCGKKLNMDPLSEALRKK